MTGFPADTSAVLRMLYNPDVLAQWHDLLTSGVVSMCPITELEFLYTVRSKADRERQKTSAGDVPLGRHAGPGFRTGRAGSGPLTARGAHRAAGLLTAAAAEAHGLVLLHYDADFVQVAAVTGQRVRWVAEPGTVD